MGKRVKKALYSQGGSVKPAPKSEKLVGEFRLPLAPGDRHLLPYGMRAPNAERIFNKRRYRDPNEGYPERGRATAGMADGGGVIDDLRESLEMQNAAEVSPERRSANLRTSGYDTISSLPVIGNVISGKEAVESGVRSYRAARSGKLKRALLEAGLTGLNTLGAVTGLPWGRGATEAAKTGSSTARIFAGPMAKTADHTALARAQEMQAAGASRDDIWKATGWGWDNSGMPYFEIDDSAAAFKPSAEKFIDAGRNQPTARVNTQVGGAFDHPALEAAYPDVRYGDLGIEAAGANGASFNTKTGRIDIAPSNTHRGRKTMLHELQHRVQRDENFAPGTSVQNFHGVDFSDAADGKMLSAFIARGMKPSEAAAAFKTATGRSATPQAMDVAMSADPFAKPASAIEAYRRTSGEVQARNVEHRADMTAAERRELAPWKTQDVADKYQITPKSPGEQQNTFVTAEPGVKSDLARRMREDGVSSPNIMRNTDRFYAPDGSLRQEVSDRGATVKRIFQPGDTATMGDVLAHEKLYRRFPHLRETPVRFVDEKFEQANAPGKVLGSAFMDKDGSGYGMTGGMPEEFYKDQGTKLLNYRVSEEAGFAPALRHKAALNLADYDHAIAMAQEIAKNPRPGEDVAQAMAFLERLQPQRDKLHAAMQTATDDRANRLVARVTNRQNDVALGNIDARIARKRATISDADRQAWGAYPYEKGTAGVGPGWRNSVILPPRGADREGTAKFIDQFTRLGAGRPGIGFANGGRTKKTRRTLAKLTVGAVRGVTEGRSDELPVSVPAGSYVIPADVVAALGDGNSEAGMHKLESTLGRPRRAAGGSVPIQISHGEFVVTPDQVEALGGHDALDQLVLRTRAAYTKHLQNLPGPNQ